MFVRLDRGAAVTPSHPARYRAVVARVGTLLYPDGPELVPASTLRASVASLVGVPLIVGHPPGQRLQARADEVVGRVESAHFDGDKLVVELSVTSSLVADAIDAGELVEFSPGYEANVSRDRVQTGRLYHHLAIGPEGWSRCGATCSVAGRADCADPDPTDPLVWGGYETALERVRRDARAWSQSDAPTDGFTFRAADRPGAFPGAR